MNPLQWPLKEGEPDPVVPRLPAAGGGGGPPLANGLNLNPEVPEFVPTAATTATTAMSATAETGSNSVQETRTSDGEQQQDAKNWTEVSAALSSVLHSRELS